MAITFVGSRKSRPHPDAMTLIEHLADLRRCLVISTIAFVLAAAAAATLYSPILHFLLRPLCASDHGHCALYVTSPLDGLSLRLKVAMFGGLLFSSPVILWQVWRFITPGLVAREKRFAVPFVVASVLLFVAGSATAFLTLTHALKFLRAVGGPDLHPIYDPISYLGLILLMMTLFGLTFEFPVVLVSLELARVVTPGKLLGWWRWAIIVIMLVAAVFTPSGDPFSMFALAVPLIAFYFISIGLGKLLGR